VHLILADVAPPYTYMDWDQRSIPHLPFGFGVLFPAFLTYRGGLDFTVVDLMRLLFDKGVRLKAQDL
jgi:hypothetical protein